MKIVIHTMVGFLAASFPAVAHAEGHAPIIRKVFKLDPESGCFQYTGRALEFIGRFKAGAYVHITMDDPERIPMLDAPEVKAKGRGIWYGPVAKTGTYSIMFYPTYTHGSVDNVHICGSMVPPDPETGFTPVEAERLNKAADTMMETDPYSKALLDEPKALIQDGGD